MLTTTKKLFAAALAAVLVLCCTGCGLISPSWAAKYDGVTYPAGLYILDVSNNYTNAMTKLSEMYEADNASVNTANLYKNTIEDMKLEDWITFQAKLDVQEYYATLQKFNELGLTLTDKQLEEIQVLTDTYWDSGDTFRQRGVSYASLKESFTAAYRAQSVFLAVCGEGGELAVPEADFLKYFKENFAAVSYCFIPLAGASDEPLSDELVKEITTFVEGLHTRAKNGEDFLTLLKEMDRYYQTLAGTEEAHIIPRSDTFFDAVLSEASSANYPEAMLESLAGMDYGDIRLVVTDAEVILMRRFDPTTDPAQISAYEYAVKSEMREEEYIELLNSWIEELDVRFCARAIARYTSKRLTAS